MMMRTLAAVVVLAVAGCTAETAAPGPEAAAKTLAEIMQADKDFAADVKANGPRRAFEGWIDPKDAKFISAGVMSEGIEEISSGFEGSPQGFTIEWAPDAGHGAASGELGVTTGRYAVKINDQTIEVGRYTSTWRKAADGAWKVVMETTIADPPVPSTAPAEPAPPPSPAPQ